jgi:hypothetical protein
MCIACVLQLQETHVHPELVDSVGPIVGQVFLAVVQLGLSEGGCWVGLLLLGCGVLQRAALTALTHLLLCPRAAVGFVMGVVFGMLTRLFLRFMR